MDLTKVGDIFKRNQGDIWATKGVKAEDLFQVSTCHLQGTRPALEDRIALAPAPLATPFSLLVGMYDGHGGERCAEFISATVPRLLSANPFANADPTLALGDTHLQLSYTSSLCDLLTSKQPFLDSTFADAEWMRFAEQNAARTGPLEDGSTGTTVLLLRNHLYIAHTGDSRAILCSNNTLFELTRDHRPDDPKELERITSHGGSVVGGRVAGKLGVSRSFGDYTFKKNGVLVVDPDVCSVTLNGEAEFLVVACDGLFETFQPQQVIEFIQSRLKEGFSKTLAKELAKEALELGSKDNVSLVILVFEPKLRKIFASAEKEEKKRNHRADRKSDVPPMVSHTHQAPRSLAQTTDGSIQRSTSPVADTTPKRKSHFDTNNNNLSRDVSDDEAGSARVSSSPTLTPGQPSSSSALSPVTLPEARKPPPRPKASPPTEIPVTRAPGSPNAPAKGMRNSKSMDDLPSSEKIDQKHLSTTPHS